MIVPEEPTFFPGRCLGLLLEGIEQRRLTDAVLDGDERIKALESLAEKGVSADGSVEVVVVARGEEVVNLVRQRIRLDDGIFWREELLMISRTVYRRKTFYETRPRADNDESNVLQRLKERL